VGWKRSVFHYQDRDWVGSRQRTDLPAFNRAMIRLFSQSVGREPSLTKAARSFPGPDVLIFAGHGSKE
jgi:hypothetical protein